MSKLIGWRGVALVMLWAGHAGTPQAGLISPLYLSSGDRIDVWQGNALIDSWATQSNGEYALAIDSTVRTYAQGFSGVQSLQSHEYGLDGTPTGVTYTNTAGCCFRDGTTDGVHNYATSNSGVFRFNTDWTNPQIVFPNGDFADSGIAYDSSNDSFWYIAPSSGSLLMNVKSGSSDVSNAFYTRVSSVLYALAFDPADQTLWVYSYGGVNGSYLDQYSSAPNTQGALPRTPMSTLAIGIKTYYAAEFALNPGADTPGNTPVPEPASIALVMIGLLGFAATRR